MTIEDKGVYINGSVFLKSRNKSIENFFDASEGFAGLVFFHLELKMLHELHKTLVEVHMLGEYREGIKYFGFFELHIGFFSLLVFFLFLGFSKGFLHEHGNEGGKGIV